MPHFVYKVRDKEGRERQATEEAATEEGLISKLQNKGLLVISVSQQEEGAARKKLTLSRGLHGHVTVDDLIVFARQLGTVLEAGVTLLKSLDILSKQIESKALLKAVQEIRHDVSEGSSFRDALAKHPRVFSEFWVHMVETGEASGALPLAMGQLANYLGSAASMRSKVASALLYPVMLIFLATGALVVFIVWVIPIFSRVFDTFDVNIPLITKMVMAFSDLARKYFMLMFGIGAGGCYFLYRYIHTEKGQWQLDKLKFRIPVVSTLFQRIAIERFASGLGTLIESGVPILYSLDIISKAIGNKVVEKAIADVREGVRQGKGMAPILENSGVFTPMAVQMVAVGEEIGDLGKMLQRMSEFYKERIATSLTRITTLIEPVILVFMGFVVGILVLSMFLPIFQLALIARG